MYIVSYNVLAGSCGYSQLFTSTFTNATEINKAQMTKINADLRIQALQYSKLTVQTSQAKSQNAIFLIYQP